MSSSGSNADRAMEFARLGDDIGSWSRQSMGLSPIDISYRQLRVLQYLLSCGGTIDRLGDLGEALRVSAAVITGLVDRLERRGYVERVFISDPVWGIDRRLRGLALTAAGNDVLATIGSILEPSFAAALKDSDVPKSDFDQALATLFKVASHLPKASGE